MTETAEKTSEQLYREWLGHRFFRYRGCAPDADDPLRMAGNPELHVGAHNGPDAWNPEGQRERRLREDEAIKVCQACPVMVECDAYASSVKADGKLAEPEGVWGGRRSLERHRALIAARHAVAAAPDRVFETEQKQAVIKALAVCWDPFEVAARAGMDVRTANWQRSSLVRLLGLPKTVTRMRALAVARERGLLEGLDVVPDDGTVLALAPPTKLPVPEPVAVAEEPVAVVLPLRRPRRSQSPAIPGQLSFESLFPATRSLEAAA